MFNVSSFQTKFIINSFCTSANKLKKDDLIYVLNFLIKSLHCIGFNFKYISLLGIDYCDLSSLTVKKLRFLFNYCKFQYLYYFLGFINKDSN